MSDVRYRFSARRFNPLPAVSATLLAMIVACGGGGGGDSAGASPAPISSQTESLSFQDNGDGTITDNTTGLQWEKKVERDRKRVAGNLHDADNCYPWSGTCSGNFASCRTDADCGTGQCATLDCQGLGGKTIFEWVAALNRDNFAGHDDWRIPTVRELQSLLDYDRYNPATDPAFEGSQCGADCTDITKPECSCTYWVLQTGSSAYWSSTGYNVPNTPDSAWIVNFALGFVYQDFKIVDFFVRAVRGGR